MTSKKQTKNPKSKTLNKPRAASHARVKEMITEPDSTYFLKLVVVVLLGAMWLRFSHPLTWQGFTVIAFPIGAVIGLLLIRLLEKDQLDRKIWYAVLLIVALACSFSPTGIVI